MATWQSDEVVTAWQRSEDEAMVVVVATRRW
jgi:hypothetical protein